jgi:hypothetical protein
VFGALASFALVATFFVDWIHVRPDFAERLRAEAESKLTGDVSATADDWRSLTKDLVRKGGASGLDVFAWTGTARAWSAAANEGMAEGKLPLLEQRARRAILVLAFLLAALPVGGAVLGLYFVTHRFRRARSPVLILSMLLGVAAVGIPAAYYRVLEGVIGQETDPAVGLTALSALGGVLLLVGAFGVKVENWWRVFAGALATGGALGVLAWFYVAWGVAP